MTSRREFVIQLSLGGTALLAGQAMAQAMVAEGDAPADPVVANLATVE